MNWIRLTLMIVVLSASGAVVLIFMRWGLSGIACTLFERCL